MSHNDVQLRMDTDAALPVVDVKNPVQNSKDFPTLQLPANDLS